MRAIENPKLTSVLAALGLIFCALLFPCVNWHYLTRYCKELTDYHLIDLSVLNAAHLDALTGAYSRLGFRHPGPILFYWYALAQYWLPFELGPQAKYALAQFVLNMLAIGGLIHLSIRNCKYKWLALIWLPLFLLLLTGKGATAFSTLSDVWNPYTPPIPTAVLIFSAACLAYGDALALLYLSIAAVVMSHAHLGALPLAASIFIVACAHLAFNNWRATGPKNWQRYALLSVIFITLTSLPVLYEAAIHNGAGNLGKIFAFSKNAAATLSIPVALSKFYPHLMKVFKLTLGLSSGGGIFLLLMLTALWIPLRQPDRLFRPTRTYACLALIVSVYSATKIQGEFFGYLIMYQFGVAAVFWILIFWRIALALDATPSTASRRQQILSATCLIALSLLPIFLIGHKLKPPRLCRGLAVHKQFADALPGNNNFYRIEIDSPSAWPFTGELATLLRRKGYDFCVPDNWAFVFDYSLSCEYREARASNAPALTYNVRIRAIEDRKLISRPGEYAYHGTAMDWTATNSAETRVVK